MGQIKHKMGNVGGGVDISHKSKMSGKAKSLMSFPGGMPGPGDYGNMEPGPAKIVGKGMAKYLAGESVGMKKMDAMHNGIPGVQQDDFTQFSQPTKSTGPARGMMTNESEGDMPEVVITPKTRREKKGKNNRLKSFEGETSAQAKARRGENKQNRKDARKEKTAGKIEKAINATKGKKSSDSKDVIKQANKAKRLAQGLKRKEGKVERKNIRKKAKEGKIIEGKSGEYNSMSKREKLRQSRKDQKAKGPALISGKKPKPKGQTTPNTNRKAKTFFDKGKDFLSGVVNHAVQGVKDDAKTIVKGAKALGSAFDRNSKK